jgi:hypothetical protein
MSKPTTAIPELSDTFNVHYEEPAIDTPRTLFSGALIIGAVVLSCIASGAVYSRLLHPADERSGTPLNGEGLILPAEPRLEGVETMSGTGDRASAAEDDRLQKYGWMDHEKKIVHVPIRRAMELAIERGWFRSAAPAGEVSTRTKPSNTSKTSNENRSAP